MKLTRDRIALAALVALGVVSSVYAALRLDVTTDITHFLPSGKTRELAALSRDLAGSELTRTLVLTLEADSEERAARAAVQMRNRLMREPAIERVWSGPTERSYETFFELYFPRRFGFASDHPAELRERLSDAGLARAARELKRQLALPTAPLVRRIAPEDPLLFFSAHVARLQRAEQGALRVVDGALVTADGRHGVVFVASRDSPFRSAGSSRVVAAIDRAFRATKRAMGGRALRLEQSGVHRFALSAERTMRNDLSRVSTISTIGIVVLFVLLFRSLRYLVLGLLPLAGGIAVSIATGMVLFGSLHGLTLAFGSALIGVCVDYASHFFNHHTLARGDGSAEDTMKRVWPGIRLGAWTTVAGLGALAWTSFPGIREVAVVSCVGVLASLAYTRYLLPPLTPDVPRRVALQDAVANAMWRGVEWLKARRWRAFVLTGAAVAICAIGLPRLRWVDDVTALSTLDPALVAEDARVRERVSRVDAGRFVVAVGRDEETALARNDAVHARLERARRDGVVRDFRSLHDLLWSARLQRESRDAVVRSPRLAERTLAALAAEGFRPEAFAPFGAALRAPAREALRYAALERSSLGTLARVFHAHLGGRHAFLTYLRGVRDARALERRLSGLSGVHYFDQTTFMRETYGQFRVRTLELVGVGLLLVLAMVWARYRTLRLTAIAFMPALLAGGATIGLLALLGEPANLLHLVGALLVLSMAVDYGVFVAETATDPAALRATLVALLVASLTTALSFGLLAMSQNPALRAIGSTIGIGVMLSLVLAPAGVVVIGTGARTT